MVQDFNYSMMGRDFTASAVKLRTEVEALLAERAKEEAERRRVEQEKRQRAREAREEARKARREEKVKRQGRRGRGHSRGSWSKPPPTT